jgi:hypothetical protein
VLDGSFESSWKSLIQLKFPVLENNFIFNFNLKPENIENVPIKNKCWRDLLKYFFELIEYEDILKVENENEDVSLKLNIQMNLHKYVIINF